MYALQKMGGVQLFRPVLVLAACMVRAAVKTLRPSALMVSGLQQAAHDFLPLAFGVAAIPIPPGWQGKAMCQLLHDAENGIFCNPVLRRCISEHAVNRARLCAIIRDYRIGKFSSGLQSKVYKCLAECVPDDWCPLLQRRLDAFAGPSNTFQVTCGSSDELSKVLIAAGKPIAMSVIKTLSNSWATSARYHEDVRKWCLVGCHCFSGADDSGQGPLSLSDSEAVLGIPVPSLSLDTEQGPPTDSLAHYLACPLLWSLIDSACRSPCTEWDLTVPQRLCLVNPTLRRVKVLAIGYRIYHAIKIGHPETWDTAVQQNSYHLLHDLVLSLARSSFC